MAQAWAYVRQSKARNEDEGDSLSTAMQEHQVRQWAQAHGYEITRVYEDQDISGRTDNRPAFREMLAALKTERVAAVITYKYSRFARNVRVFANAHGELQDRGVALLSATESADTRMVQVSALMADWYSTDLSEFVSAAVRQKMRRGGWHGRPPFGYTKDVGTQRLVVDPDAAVIVAEVFDKFTAGEPIMRILSWLRSEPSGIDRVWSYQAVRRMLTRRTYLGHTPGMDDTHPPIVTAEVFDRAASVMGRLPSRQAKAVTSPLEGMIVCGACGLRMHLMRQAPNGMGRFDRFWRCDSLHRRANYGDHFPAHQQTYRADWIEDAVRDRLAADIAGRLPVADALRIARQAAHSDTTDKRRAALERQRGKAQAGRDRLLDLFRDGRLDADRWETADRDAAEAVARIDRDLATLPAVPDPLRYEAAERTLQTLSGVLYTSGDPDVQADLDAALCRFLVDVGAVIQIDARPPRKAGRKRTAPTVTITYGEPYARLICPP